MPHPTGRHRKPHHSLTSRLWALTAALLALALAAVFVPHHPEPARAALPPPPRRRPPERTEPRPSRTPPEFPDPDRLAGALVRPYMPPLPRLPVGDLLADPAPATPASTAPASTAPASTAPAFPSPPGEGADFSDLTAAVRRYLAQAG